MKKKKKANTNHIAHQIHVTGVGAHRNKKKYNRKEKYNMDIVFTPTKFLLKDILDLTEDSGWIAIYSSELNKNGSRKKLVESWIEDFYETDLIDFEAIAIWVTDMTLCIQITYSEEHEDTVRFAVEEIKEMRE